jgi:pyruvate formate lyase activating enzyme
MVGTGYLEKFSKYPVPPINKEVIMAEGYIHSTESMGTVDGPGIRFVVFTQGCPLRCQYCHNPDTWKLKEGKKVSTEALMQKIIKIKPYIERSGGGLTISGGEPTMQPEFTLDLLKKAKAEGLHTAVDTSGFVELAEFKKLLPYLDLVLLDIKTMDNLIHQELTGVSNQKTLKLVELLEAEKQPYWVRQVIVPGITDDLKKMRQFAEYLKTKKYLEKIELLPYHELGKHKWENLGLEYKLAAVEPPSKKKMAELNAVFKNYKINIA